jgi:hypothetical protein
MRKKKGNNFHFARKLRGEGCVGFEFPGSASQKDPHVSGVT